MQRWELSAFGRENRSLVSVPRPVPGADELLVEVEAVSLNFRDSQIMENRLGAGYSVPLAQQFEAGAQPGAVGTPELRLA